MPHLTNLPAWEWVGRPASEPLQRFLISPPFGNWIGHRNCTRVLGSFTWQRRPGLIRHTLRSLRPIRHGWINQIGLRNPGIRSKQFDRGRIYSLVGLEDGDWEDMLMYCPYGLTVEINLGCPNVHRYGIPFSVLEQYRAKFDLIVKLPPSDEVDDLAEMCVRAGVRFLHCCNTISTERGGESGQRLFTQTLPIVTRLVRRYPAITVIAGGGIYGVEQLRRYEDAGAKHFSLSTVWFTPWRVSSMLAYQ